MENSHAPMDAYTRKTKTWLDRRFRQADADGIYFAHQPIYGFRDSHSEPGMMTRYMITFQIMKALSHLTFESVADIGGAEGYKAALIRAIFNSSVTSCDLSEEACKRAKEIYQINGEAVDIGRLPFKDNCFDIVLCSETLEHVRDFEQATEELLRVCRKAVIITVPIESPDSVEQQIKAGCPHAHIHSLDRSSFDFALSTASRILKKAMLSPLLKLPNALVEASTRPATVKYPAQFLKMYNFLTPLLRKLFGKKAAEVLMLLDDVLSSRTRLHSGMMFVILKDAHCFKKYGVKKVKPAQITGFEKPYHYLHDSLRPETGRQGVLYETEPA